MHANAIAKPCRPVIIIISGCRRSDPLAQEVVDYSLLKRKLARALLRLLRIAKIIVIDQKGYEFIWQTC